MNTKTNQEPSSEYSHRINRYAQEGGVVLRLAAVNYSDEFLDISQSCPKVKRINIRDCNPPDLDFLKPLSELVEIKASENPSLKCVNAISSLRNVTVVDFDGCNISDLSFLKGLSLEQLQLNGNKEIEENEWEHLKNMTSLKYLSIAEIDIKNSHFLLQLRGLEYLDITKTRISDLNFLNHLPNLQVLKCAENHEITNIDAISSLKKLMYLDISYCEKIESFSPVSNLVKLKYLNICGIENDNFLPLKVLSTQDQADGNNMPGGLIVGSKQSPEFLGISYDENSIDLNIYSYDKEASKTENFFNYICSNAYAAKMQNTADGYLLTLLKRLGNWWKNSIFYNALRKIYSFLEALGNIGSGLAVLSLAAPFVYLFLPDNAWSTFKNFLLKYAPESLLKFFS